MVRNLFLGASVLHALAALYYVRRFFMRRRPISLVLAVLALGWPLAFLREIHALPLAWSGWFWWGGMVVSVLHLVAIYGVESQVRR